MSDFHRAMRKRAEQKAAALEIELAALRAMLSEAPVVYMTKGMGHFDAWTVNVTDLDGKASHMAKLICIEEIGK